MKFDCYFVKIPFPLGESGEKIHFSCVAGDGRKQRIHGVGRINRHVCAQEDQFFFLVEKQAIQVKRGDDK